MADAAIGIVLFLILGAFLYGPWQWIFTDIIRQKLFEHRDAIFDMACEGRLSFKSAEYRAIRESLERTIRYSHDITFPNILFAMVVKHRHLVDLPPIELFEAMREIKSKEDEKTYDEVFDHVARALVSALAISGLKSPFFVITIPFMLIIKKIPELNSKVQPFINRAQKSLQIEADAAYKIDTA